MIVVYAPDRPPIDILKMKTVFLAGSIEMGKAIPWQDKLVSDLQKEKVVLLNPRRPDWDSSWVQDPTKGTKFHEQVTWEQDMIEKADVVVFFFDPKTQSPITLLELGSCLNRKDVVVCCPKDYFRYGNVKITCDRHNIPVVETYEKFVEAIQELI